MQLLYLKSDTTLVYGEATAIINSEETTISTGSCTGVVKNSAGTQVGSSITLTYDANLKDWRGTFEDPWVDDNAAVDALVVDAEYTVEITLAGSGDFSGIDDFRSLEAIGVVRGEA